MRSVMLAHPSNDLYGSDRMALRTAIALQAAGHRVQVVLPNVGTLHAQARESDLEVATVQTLVLQKSLFRLTGLVTLGPRVVLSLVRCLRHIRATRPDVLYVNTVTLPIWILAGRLSRVPVLVHVREAEELSGLVRRVLLGPLLLASRIVVNSESTGRNVTSTYRRLNSRVTVIYNGLTFPRITPRRPSPPPYEIVLVGRLSPRKGQDVALEALAHLRACGVDARLTLVGDWYPGYEGYVEQLRERTAALGLGDVVRFQGFVDDVWSTYVNAHLALVPSRTEPFGNVAVEAMAMGTAVIASDVQGLREIVRHGHTGVLVPPAQAEVLAKACESLLSDAALRERLGAAGEADVRLRFGADRYNREIVDLVEQMQNSG
jgi:glycosyltransferase involved in cell wall biosynthesis